MNCCGRKDLPTALCIKCTLKNLSRRKFGNSDRWHELEMLLKGQNERCAVTGVKIQIGVNASLDRIIPENRGGSNRCKNLRWVHIVVNRIKNDMTDSEMLQWCQRIVKSKNLINRRASGVAYAIYGKSKFWPSGFRA
jgi:hypothetical protein